MGVIHDGPGIPRVVERGGHVRLPDALREPCAARALAEGRRELAGHPSQLADPVALGQRREHRLAPAAAQDLHLATLVERAEPFHGLRALAAQPFEEGPRVVQPEAHLGMPLERLDHGQVRRVVVGRDDIAEVAHRLVVVEHERERDSRGHGAPDRSSTAACDPGPGGRRRVGCHAGTRAATVGG